ncbi:MAG TPA: amidase [Solirubrobacteraceae bacterium]|nr:amidase [Solirubrobacteraceae bacterium]
MSESDLMFRPAGELAAMVRGGELSSAELVQASLERIEELNPQVNAFVDVDEQGALATAEQVRPGDERPFAGVPIAIKNNRAVRGLRLTYGCALLREHVAGHDDAIVRRVREAGFVIVGTTTLPEFAIMPVSEARLFGPTRNPWDLQRTPGGSSGGAGAAVAAGMVPVAQGSDGGGSIRIPAACCGLVGLKASRGRISPAPRLGDSRLSVDGVLTRTVAETAAILDVLAGYELGDATWAPAPQRPFAVVAGEPPVTIAGGPRAGGLRVAATTVSPNPDARLEEPCAAAVADAARLLGSLGHEVIEVDPPWQRPGLSDLVGRVFAIDVAHSIVSAGLLSGREPSQQDVEPLSWAVYSLARATSALEGQEAVIRLQALARELIAFLDPYDALLTPALAQRPLPLGTLDATAPEPMRTFTRSGLFTPFTPIVNALGLPAISLPLYAGEDGLPTAVQLVGRPLGEGNLLALGAQLEDACPWAERRSPVARELQA